MGNFMLDVLKDVYPGVLVILGLAVLHCLVQFVHGRFVLAKGE